MADFRSTYRRTGIERVAALPEKLTRAELIGHIVEQFNINKHEVNKILECVFSDIKQALAEGRTVELRSFGTFEIHIRAKRNARNPKTGERLVTEERGAVFFRPGREMKQMVKDAAVSPPVGDTIEVVPSPPLPDNVD